MMKSCCIKKFLIVFLVVVSVCAYADQYGNGGDDHQDADAPGNSYATFENFPNLSSYDDDLSFSYYQKSCPDFEAIVHKKVDEWIQKDYTLAASLIRLHYQDCVVRGCDASILLDHEGSEMTAKSSKTLRGFELIDDIKQEIEKKCPKIVSCSDILTSAVREAVLKIGGPFYMVPYGRKDGKISLVKDAESLPVGHEKITDLIEFFQSKGLCVLDLVVLLGAHTIGRTTCGSLQNRLYNFNGTAGQCDPTIDPKYANFLKRKCRWASEYVDFDGFSPQAFNNEYYKNLQRNMGLLATDQLLYKDSRTAGLVNALASQPELFHAQFAASMVKLGRIQEGDDDDGEVRLKCSCVNA